MIEEIKVGDCLFFPEIKEFYFIKTINGSLWYGIKLDPEFMIKTDFIHFTIFLKRKSEYSKSPLNKSIRLLYG